MNIDINIIRGSVMITYLCSPHVCSMDYKVKDNIFHMSGMVHTGDESLQDRLRDV